MLQVYRAHKKSHINHFLFIFASVLMLKILMCFSFYWVNSSVMTEFSALNDYLQRNYSATYIVLIVLYIYSYVVTDNKLFSIFSITAPNIIVSLGRQKLSGINLNEISRTISQAIVHPNYNSKNQNNDIALLQLSSSVSFTNYIRPICLAAANSTFGEGTKIWITGWGKLHFGGEQHPR